MARPSLRALVVDDDSDMRALVQATIRRANEGLAVAAEASTGEEGLDLWREHRPDIVVLDQRMPGITGLDVAEQILSEEPDQPIILFSAYLDDDLRQASSRLGIRACLDKRDVRRLPDVIWDIVQAS